MPESPVACSGSSPLLTVYSKEEWSKFKSSKFSDWFGVFYLIEYGAHVKIGYTTNLYQRMMAFKREATNYNDRPIGRVAISLLHTNYRETEKFLHTYFKSKRRENTELFDIDFDVVVKEINEGIPGLVLKDESKKKEQRSKAVFEFFKQGVHTGWGLNEGGNVL